MTDLTLQEKKRLLLDAIQTVDQITNEVKDNYPHDDTESIHLEGGETWDAQNYKSFLIRKLGAIEYELQNKEEDTTNTEEEEEVEQVTQQEQDNNTTTTTNEEEKQEKEEDEEVKP